MADHTLVSHFKYCEFCGKPISRSSESTYCPDCQETVLFQAVREYIRDNVVNEFQVADRFNIPLRMVKGWIREGRIEYRTAGDGKSFITNIRCSRCGAPATFGTVCNQCLKLLNTNVHGYGKQTIEDDKMRFLDSNPKDF